ncbi:hypothetical protein [Methylobacterium dankookense]|uniref:Uncharacterized protein n=1 Tax=Methylobacterium dankookense TaxID=560405 RepID=A0A564G502_9HYPH|nr:hypothetical protein [Methylobacterium dankookense]GJD59818.1 hypothetical protein IFDJLNFL_5749 [Methylobacterium dankookense]VUF15076.1 hypothetical protein MTDSW087_04809 [Methylobacterium dankookense]
MQGDDPLIPEVSEVEATNGFQLQLGPDGRCRIVLLGKGHAPIACLELDAANADRLAEELAERRRTYEQGKAREKGRAPH